MKKRLLSFALALCMMLTQLPISAMAEEADTSAASGEIIAFAPLDETEMSAPTGTAIEDLGLPESLTAMVRTTVTADSSTVEEPVQDSGNPVEGTVSESLAAATSGSAIEAETNEPQGQDTEEEPVPRWEEVITDIPVTWEATPEYQGNKNGVYIFTPVIEGYTVSADLPEITVTVGEMPSLAAACSLTAPAQAQWGIAGSDGSAPTEWTEGTLAAAISYANSNTGTYVQILTDIGNSNHSTWPLTFDRSKTTILDLNGNDINRGLTEVTENGNVITVNGNLTIKDGSTTDVSNQGHITGGFNSGDTGGVYAHGYFTLEGGNITGNKSTSSGGGVMIANYCTFNMQGGSIAGNEATSSGGAVYAPLATFIMNGGSITGNQSADGGVYFGKEFRVGGRVVIKGNTLTSSSVERNVVVPTGKEILINALTPGASIGVTAESVPAIGSPVDVAYTYYTSNYSAYFFSDNSSYIIQNGTDNVVQLAVGPVIGTLAISDPFTAGHSLTLDDLESYKPTITNNGVTITAQGWQTPDGSGNWTNWSAGVLPLDTSGTFKLRYYAAYSGGTVYSNEVTLTVVGNTTALALTASPASPQSAGTQVTLTATLTGFFSGPGVNGQTITFKNGETTLGTANLNAAGVAAYIWTPSDAGTYSLTAEYASTAYNKAATSSAVSYTVIVDPDIAIVAGAKTDAQGASYSNMTQVAATDEETIKAALNNTAATAVNNSDVTITINNVAYTAPIAGTSANPGGTNGSYTFTVTVSKGSQSETTEEKTMTITATPYTGGTGGNGNTGGSGSSSNTPSSSTKPTEPVTGSTENKATVDNKGNANVSLTDKNITDAIADAKAEAAKKGVNAGDITAVIHATTAGKDANTVTVNLPKTTQEQVIGNKIASVQLVIDRPDLTIGINLAAVTEINRQAKADVQLSATRMDNKKLSGDAKAAIGNRPTYDLKALYGSGKSVTDFGKGSISVEIPYTLQKGEIAGNVYVAYVDAKGKVTYLTDSSYDAQRGTVVFSTSHFSTYGIAYKASFNFTDIDGHWAKDDILFVANRGLMTGTSATTFSPNGSMTRGMFVTALGRLANADISAYKQSSFTDVKADAYYMGYIEWGVKNNILAGIGGKFDPDALVTREQMAAIMDRYATAIGFKLPEVHTQNVFADNTTIGAWAAPSVKRIQMAGIIQGKNNNFYDPQGTATRAEVSAVLRRFVELTVFSDTAQGWVKNDSGQWMFFKNGKALTGWQTINGKVYCFDSIGGAFASGWKQNAKDEWLFLSSDGNAVTGWKDMKSKGNTKRYYFDTYGIMVAGKWLQIDGKWYYFYADGSLAKDTKVDGYEVGSDGARKTK